MGDYNLIKVRVKILNLCNNEVIVITDPQGMKFAIEYMSSLVIRNSSQSAVPTSFRVGKHCNFLYFIFIFII